MNILPLIYDERAKRCNIMVFDSVKARSNISIIEYEDSGKGRKHPVYRFYDKNNEYICEVRYGGASANALQRGLWTHTKSASAYFDSVTNGWIDYTHNIVLVKLISHALVSSQTGHGIALKEIQADIDSLKQGLKQ